MNEKTEKIKIISTNVENLLVSDCVDYINRRQYNKCHGLKGILYDVMQLLRYNFTLKYNIFVIPIILNFKY